LQVDDVPPASNTFARAAYDAADAKLLATRERSVWLALDSLLRRLAEAAPGAIPLPTQLLGLLPDASWPDEFRLVDERARFEGRSNHNFSPAPADHPAHRRATRLSYGIWTVCGGASQEVLECGTAAERLRLAARRLEALQASI